MGLRQMYSHIAQPLRALQCTKAKEMVTFCDGRVQDGSQFVSRVAAISAGILQMGLEPGDRVAIVALNSEWFLEWLLGVPSAGCIIAPLNYRWSVQEASEAIREIEAAIVVLDVYCLSWAPVLKTFCPSLRWVVFMGAHAGQDTAQIPCWINAEDIIHSAGPDRELQFLHGPKSIALICFTSGTTGKPKGVMLTHNSLIVQSLAKISVVGYSSKDIYLHTATLCHIGGISSALATIMANGCHIILPRFRALEAFQLIHEHKVSTMIVVPTIMNDIIAHWENLPSRRTGDGAGQLRTVTTILNGAGSLTSLQLRTAKKIFPSSTFMSAYGMTEACSSITFLHLRDGKDEEGVDKPREKSQRGLRALHFAGVCVGEPPSHVEVRIKSDWTDEPTKVHERNVVAQPVEKAAGRDGLESLPSYWREFGEPDASGGGRNARVLKAGNVLTRGAHVMDGYWGRSSEVEKALQPDGWLDTGDVGWLDESGNLWLLGRQKDVIRSGEETVYSSEVEAVLVTHPAVLAAVVVGVPDARLGQTVACLVRLRENWSWRHAEDTKEGFLANIINESLLKGHCRQAGLSRYKIPTFVILQEEDFPMTTTGKVRKDDVRNRILSLLEARQIVRKLHTEFSNSPATYKPLHLKSSL